MSDAPAIPRAAGAVSLAVPSAGAVLELLKPVTWFAPMWAFMCGAISTGAPLAANWAWVAAGMVLAGPLICGMSQAANDWCDRHVDAINEPDRPIPSGRMPGRWGLRIAWIWTALSLAVAALLGPWVFGASCLGVALAWAYSAPPLRLKRSGWIGPAAVALAYEGLTWFTGAALLTDGAPNGRILALAALYAIGAHGIMTLNDFKAVEGDRATGLRSLPVTLGTARAARLASATMAAPQIVVIALLAYWGLPTHAAIVAALLAGQGALMRIYLFDDAALQARPKARAAAYAATGVTLFVLGMLTSALGLAALAG